MVPGQLLVEFGIGPLGQIRLKMMKVKTLLPSAALALAMAGIGGVASAQDEDIIVVRGALVPDEKRQSTEISSVLDADALERIGDSDVAGALRRITGISVTGGRFPVARGLNERYSSVTLNGVPIPSPEPLRRAAPLDIIPTSVIGGSLAQKTFSPQFSGEFGGAAIDLQTIARPADDFLTLKASLGLDTESAFRNGLFHDGSDTDVFGWDDGLRDLPSAAASVIAAGGVADDTAQVALDTGFEQYNTLAITSGDVPVNGSGSVSFGKIFDFDSGATIGSTTFVGYDNTWEHREGFADREDTFASGVFSGQQRKDFTFEETRQNIQLNALNTTGFQSANGDHEIALTTYLLRDTLKRSRIADILNERDVSENLLRQESTDFLERQIWQAQLNGSHFFPGAGDLEANWRLSYGEAERDAPYERQSLRQQTNAGNFQAFNNTAGDNSIIFSDLKDENLFAAIDFTKPLEFEQVYVDLKFGGAYADNSRVTNRNVFSLGDAQIGGGTDLLDSSWLLILSDPVTASGLIDYEYNNTTQEPNVSTGDLEVTSGYAMANIEFNEFLSGMVGVRYEESTQSSSTLLSSDATTLSNFDDIEEEYFLPAATVTWRPNDQWQFRAGYSETIARPQFRELVFTDFQDLDFDAVLRGNPFLQNSELKNYDVRAEYYFGGRGEFITLGAFFKEIDKPIEQYETGGEDNAYSFINAPSAELFGIEAEFQKVFLLDEIFEGDFWNGKEFLFLTNYTYSDSEVQSSDTEQVILASATPGGVIQRSLPASLVVRDGRPLVGQSEHLYNLQLGIEDVDTGTKATVLLNYASERVLYAEVNASQSSPPAVVEQPPVSLDFVLSQDLEIGQGVYGLGIKVQNILGEDFNTFRTDTAGTERTFLEYDRGTKFSVSLSREF